MTGKQSAKNLDNLIMSTETKEEVKDMRFHPGPSGQLCKCKLQLAKLTRERDELKTAALALIREVEPGLKPFPIYGLHAALDNLRAALAMGKKK